jgi:hypothetical protein
MTEYSSQPCRPRRMRCSWMVIMQVRRQVIANDVVASYGRLEQVFLHTPRQVGPQRKRGSAEHALELVC